MNKQNIYIVIFWTNVKNKKKKRNNNRNDERKKKYAILLVRVEGKILIRC